jgi:hypothetical protein
MSWESTAKMNVYEIHFLERGMNPVSRQICERRASPHGDRSEMVCALGSDGEGTVNGKQICERRASPHGDRSEMGSDCEEAPL